MSDFQEFLREEIANKSFLLELANSLTSADSMLAQPMPLGSQFLPGFVNAALGDRDEVLYS